MIDVGPPSASVARNIKRLRRIRGWTAADLAREVTASGVPWIRQVVSCVENGRRRITVDELAALGAAFGVEPWSLTGTPRCRACNGAPPAGYACLTCGEGRATDEGAMGGS